MTVPSALALNETHLSGGIEITLLAVAVVDDLVRVSGVLRAGHRPDVRLVHVPQLSVSRSDGSALSLVSAHLIPHGAMAWVSWVYERPARTTDEYEGRIERVELTFRRGGQPEDDPGGPWIFHFRLPQPRRLAVETRLDLTERGAALFTLPAAGT